GADVEGALGAAEHEQVVEHRGQLLRARGLQRSAPVGVAAHCESVTTRRARVGEELIPQAMSWVMVPATRAWASSGTPRPIKVTGVPGGSSRSRSTTVASLKTAPITQRGLPAT